LTLRVVDTSVVIKWYIDGEPDSDSARRLLLGVPHFAVPDLMFAEVANVLWKKVQRGEITEERATAITRLLPDGPFEIYSDYELMPEALRIAVKYSITAYDASYVALAIDLGVEFATTDRKLSRKLHNTPAGTYVTLLADSIN
jgi:predicted nucleic acid-binding protein